MSESIEKKRRSCPKRRRSPERQCILPISSLVGMALQQWDSERSWDAIHELRLRATPETVERCQKMFRSRNWRKRALAINVMCQLQQRLGRWKSADYAVYQAHSMLRAGLRDPHSQVVAAAAFGCGHRRNADDTALLIALASHASADVRLGVAFGLCFHEDERAVDTLIQLAGDRDDEVRNWATFGLAELEMDTPAIRERLWRNTQDRFDEVRDEAVKGLEYRGDPRVADQAP